MNQSERVFAALTYEFEGNTVRGYDEKHHLRRIFSVSDEVAKKLREQTASEAVSLPNVGVKPEGHKPARCGDGAIVRG